MNFKISVELNEISCLFIKAKSFSFLFTERPTFSALSGRKEFYVYIN